MSEKGTDKVGKMRYQIKHALVQYAGDIHMNNLDSDEECGIVMAGKQEIGFLRQISFTEGDVTVEEEIKKTFAPVFECETRMAEIEQLLHEEADNQKLVR